MKRLFTTIFSILVMGLSYGQQAKVNLMPLPEQISFAQGEFEITDQLTIGVYGTQNTRSFDYADRTLRRIADRTGLFIKQDYLNLRNNPNSAQIEVRVERDAILTLAENEDYFLKIGSDKIVIQATTEFGAFNGLETLYQLLTVKDGKYILPNCEISDRPRFVWRGLMLDVARHFLSVDDIKRNIDLMSSVKLNVLHWHLSDDQGFRVEVKQYPELHQLGSDGKFYTHEQIKDVVKYASDRGIRVVPEIDVPGHASAILAAMPQLASKKGIYSIERNAGIFTPVLDPTNPLTYQVLEAVFMEISQLFPDQFIHIGGDENEGLDWMSNLNIVAFMKDNKIEDAHALQAYFNLKLHNILKKFNKEMMGWEEIQNPSIPKSSIIHSWRGVNEGVEQGLSLASAVKNGYRAILSNGFYIDLMLPASEHYKTQFTTDTNVLTQEENDRILGGEATMWSELVTPLTIDSRIWPRTAAIAEVLWSPKEKTVDVADMYRRLEHISNVLESLGSTHLRNRDYIVRNISNNVNSDAVLLLSDLCEPLKIYTRNPGGTMYQSYSPFVKFADACVVDAKGAREFGRLVDRYITDKGGNKKELVALFNVWKNNHSKIEQCIAASPQLNEISQKSENLAKLGTLALELISSRRAKEKDVKKALEFLMSIEKEDGGRTELAILKDYKRLIISLR